MRTVAPAVTRAAAIGTAAAAVGVLAFTAIADSQAGHRAPSAGTTPEQQAPTHPVTPVPDSTLPGSVDSPAGDATDSHVTVAQKKRWLHGLTGTWTRNVKNTYFRFHADGSGEWVAFGQKLWTGTATPRDARNFDLSDPDGHGGAYWQVKLIGRHRLLFAGTRQTFTRA
jgi:hypothetical protein